MAYPKGIPDDTPLGHPNCGVISLAMVCGISHAEAWDALKTYDPRRYGKGWKGRTYDIDRLAIMRQRGLVIETLPRFDGSLRQWLKSDQYSRAKTYELCITGHAMVLHRGRFFDQNAGKRGILTIDSPYLRRRMSTVTLIKSGSPLTDNLHWTNPKEFYL